MEDVKLEETLVVSANHEITLDLNGLTISGTDTLTGSYSLVSNNLS